MDLVVHRGYQSILKSSALTCFFPSQTKRYTDKLQVKSHTAVDAFSHKHMLPSVSIP